MVIDDYTITTPPLVTEPVNTAPIVNAGQYIIVFLPANSCQLTGLASDKENNIISIHWRNISDTLSYLIHNPNSLETTVSNLELGIYQFELKVTDSGGLISKDTCKVIVGSSTGRTILLENQIWIFPWYNAIVVNNFNSLVSQNPFKIYIKRDSNPNWIEVPPVSYSTTSGPYEYFIENRPNGAGIYTFGSLYIFYYGSDVSDTPDVKIEY